MSKDQLKLYKKVAKINKILENKNILVYTYQVVG